MIEITIEDEISPVLKEVLHKTPEYLRKVTKSVGYFIQKEVKAGIKSGAPGGVPFKERIPYRVRKDVQGGSAAIQWYGKMKQAVGYQYRDGEVLIGWTSSTAAMYGRKQEKGYSIRVTRQVRKKWAKAGHPLMGNKTEIRVPKRPVFDPMAKVIEPKIAPYVEEKVSKYMESTVEIGKRSRRKYKVY